MSQEWSISHLARLTATTSRTLRHYGDLGLLPPTRVGRNGYRYYDQSALVRLQRILLLRDLGLGLPAIAEVLDRQADEAAALRGHERWLRAEQERLDRQIRAVRTTIDKLERGDQIMADEALAGFDHTQYKDEVEQRWGADAYAQGDAWWRSLSDSDKRAFGQEQQDIAAAYGAARTAGLAADSDEVQAITQRHFEWLRSVPATPRNSLGPTAEYFTGLGEMYVADERFRANYDKHEPGTAELIRDAMAVYAERNLRSGER